MASLVNKVIGTYNHIVYDLADARVSRYYLLSSPVPILTLTALYLYFCTTFGPRYMKDRKPYNLKNVILLYNVFQVFLSTYLFVAGLLYMLSGQFNIACGMVDYSDNPVAIGASFIGVCYFYTKVVEFLDTIFFVLRKKNNQISFLHVYHHSMMALTIWIGAKYFSGGHGAMTVTLNSFVHIIMYAYYLIAGLGPQYQKYVWWKKHVTVLQLIQFVIIFVHSAYPFFTDCQYPKMILIITSFNALLFINLFGRFFYANYIKSSDKKNGIVIGIKNGEANGIKNGDCNENGVSLQNGSSVKNEACIQNGHEKYLIKTEERPKDR